MFMHSITSNSLVKIKILVYKPTIPYQYQVTVHFLFLPVFLLSQHGSWWRAVNILPHLTRIMRTYTAVNAWLTAVSKIIRFSHEILYTLFRFKNAVLYIWIRFSHEGLYTLFRYSHAVKLLWTTHCSEGSVPTTGNNTDMQNLQSSQQWIWILLFSYVTSSCLQVERFTHFRRTSCLHLQEVEAEHSTCLSK